MNPFKLFSILLGYPTAELQTAIWQDLQPMLEPTPELKEKLQPLLDYLIRTDLISIQENYVATFDRNPNHALHLFEHLHGENRDRGSAMVNLLHEYQQQGFEPQGYELPDYLPLFLEFLALQDEAQAKALLSDAVHVIAYIRDKLKGNESLYALVFDLIIDQSPVAPQALKVAPIRDMDEALETFGPMVDGTEPLLNKKPKDVQILNIRPRQHMNNI